MIEADNLSDLETVRHGFFTREGGVSEGRFASLNCGFSSGDDSSRVNENRARAMRRLDVPVERLCTVRQVHGTQVLAVRDALSGPQPTGADALVTDRTDMAIGVLCADCAPVLFADPEAGVIGCAHAGWRGALAGVVEATVSAMAELGADPARMTAAVGPCIAQTSYEVGPDLRGPVIEEDSQNHDLFAPVNGSDRLLFDLKTYVLRRLARAGVQDRLAMPEDTLADEAR
ncbi:MAG: polyphenol oxidase family protein, partial [Pseudomonadota bacterium]